MSIYSELKRRNVFRVAAAYLAGAWLLVEVAETLFPLFGFSDTPARLTAILLAIGFPITLVLSWVYELTPEGLKLEKDLDRTGPAPRTDTRRLDRAIIGLLVLALGYFAVDKFVLEPGRVAEIVEETAQQVRSEALVESYGEKSIAVLPFVNMSADPEQEYFSDGISEELLNLLAKIPELRVTARTSSFAFKGREANVRDIANKLGVAHILEGSVRKSGDQVRITAQLIEARSDTHLWSETYDRELGDIFAIQDEIAGVISDSLKIKLDLADGKAISPTTIKTTSLDAYDAFLRARELLHDRKKKDMEQAISLLERCLRLDESFAPAHALLAIASLLAHGPNARQVAISHLNRAQELQPDLAEVYGGRALLALADDPDAAVRYAQKALELNPSYADALNWLFISLKGMGRKDEAEKTLLRLLVTDPLFIPGRLNYTQLLADTNRFEEAARQADQLLTIMPYRGQNMKGYIALMQGEVTEGLSWLLKAREARATGDENYWIEGGLVLGFAWIGQYSEASRVDPETTQWVDFAAGRLDDAIKKAREMFAAYPDYKLHTSGDLAIFLYFAGRNEEALSMFEIFVENLPPQYRDYWEFHMIASDNEMMMRLANVRRKTGDEQRAQQTVEAIKKNQNELHAAGWAYSWLYRADAMIAAFDNDQDAAIEALELAIEHGHRAPYFFDDPVFDSIRGDPRFIGLHDKLGAMLGTERERTLQLICFHNPVPDDWRPLPETCQGVKEQRGP